MGTCKNRLSSENCPQVMYVISENNTKNITILKIVKIIVVILKCDLCITFINAFKSFYFCSGRTMFTVTIQNDSLTFELS